MRIPHLSLWSVFLGTLIGCGSETPEDTKAPDSAPVFLTVKPGESIGSVKIGMDYAALTAALGQADQVFGFQRIITLRYNSEKIEVVMSSSDLDTISDDAKVRAVGTLSGASFQGALSTELTYEQINALYDKPMAEQRGIAYYSDFGLAVKFDDNGRASRFSVWEAYTSQTSPPEMLPAQTQMPTEMLGDTNDESIRYEFGGEAYEVVDMHLHVGKSASQQTSGLEFILSQLPDQTVMYFPSTASAILDPYSEHLGVREHVTAAGIAHAVLLATYTQRTIGYAENRLLESLLNDPRNKLANGRPWAWGMASLNFEDFGNSVLAEQRLFALNSYFEKRPDLFIGIKLAHAHQAVRFDDDTYLGVYDIAAKHEVPLLLHTGFSPFPHTMKEPEYYDPQSLKAVIEAYDGHHGQGRVDFVLAHVGQGDARAIEHSLQLASTYDNVWLEISAINRPLDIDGNGKEIVGQMPMHSYVLAEIKKRNLIGRTIYGSDGPQYFGKLQSYLRLMVSTMDELGYDKNEIQSVLADNFYRCFRPALH